MPFVAKNKNTGERVDITQIENPRLELKDEYICQLPDCGHRVFIKAGMITSAHFCHYAACKTEYQIHGESEEHRLAKRLLAEKLKTFHDEYMVADIQYEVPIPEARRVADVLATFPMGWRVAHEIQLSGLTTEDLQARTDDYAKAGVDVVWWIGNTANTYNNRNWCISNYGFCYELSFSTTAKTNNIFNENEND